MSSLNSNALTTLADVKESLGLTSGDSSKNNLIIRKINQASQQIETYCSRVFAAATYTEYYNGTGIDQLVLNQRPVNSLTSIEARTSAINQSSFITIDPTFYFLDDKAGIIKLDFNAEGRWDRYRVVYNAGYTTIPSDLAEACASLASYYVNNPDGSNIGVLEKTEGQRRQKFANTAQTFKTICEQLGINQTLDGYANWPLKNE